MGAVPQTSHPILVMELMERNLTQFLEEADHDISIHLQVNLCLDISFALAYLHSQQIVHGHLTSNNVLLVGTTAKVADFGISKLLDTQSSGTHNALYLPPEARVSHREFSEKSDIFSLGVLTVQIITREAPTLTREVPTPSTREQQLDVISLGVQVVQIVMPIPQQQPAPLSEVDRRQQHIQKIASTHPLRDIALQCLKDTAMERPTAKKVITKLTAVKYHPQYEDSLKQEREKVQREIAQLKEKLKPKEELALKQTQAREKQMWLAQQEIAQLKEKLKSKEELALKQTQASKEQIGLAQQEIAQLKEKLKSKDELALKQTEASKEQIGLAQRDIAQLRVELRSKEEFIQKQKQESEKQKEIVQQQLKERDQEIASIRLAFGTQHQTALALKKEVEVKSIQVQDREKQILKQSQESQKQMGVAKREIAQLKEKLKSKEELALKEKQDVAQLKEKLKSREELVLKQTQAREKQMGLAQQEIAQLKEKLKSKEELALKQTQAREKQMGLAQQEIAQLQAELKLKEEFTQKQKQESEKQNKILQQQLKGRDQEIASIGLTFGKQNQTVLALKKEVEVKSIQVQDRDKQILKQSQESQKQMGVAKREITQLKEELKSKEDLALKEKQEIAQLKEKLKSREELALKERQESEKQMTQLQQQLRDKDKMITTVQAAYGTQHQALLVMTRKLQNESEGAVALRKELEEKVEDRDKQVQACEMEVKKVLQQSQKKDIKIAELEEWKKNTKDKLLAIASPAE